MSEYEFVERAIDSNGFMTSATGAGYINPTYWNRRLLEHVSTNLVAAQFAVDYSDLLGDGDTLKVNVEVEPTASAALTESTDITVTAYEATTTVSFSPSEHGKMNQLHDKEARRSFFSVMERMMMNLGYAMALELDSSVISSLSKGSNSIVAGGVVSSSIATSDVLTPADIAKAVMKNKIQKFPVPNAFIVSPYGEKQLLTSGQITNAYQAGDNIAIRNGFLGRIYGVPVYVSTQITTVTASTTGHSTVTSEFGYLLSSRTGVLESFGICWKQRPEIRTQRWEAGRFTYIVGVNEWDVQILRPYSICKVEYAQA